MEAYSLLADTGLTIAREAKMLPRFKAHIVYTILTNSGILFSDTHSVACANLRRLMQTDATIVEAARAGHISIAIRDSYLASQERPLAALRDSFMGKTHHVPAEVFRADGDLAIFEAARSYKPWNTAQVEQSFGRLTRQVLDGQIVNEKLGEKLAAAIRECVAERAAQGQAIDRQFFYTQLSDELAKRKETLDPPQEMFIRQCADAPYFSNLPQVLDVVPIYAKDHQAAFEILRGHAYETLEIDAPRRFRTVLDQMHFIEGLNRLTIDDVAWVRETGAAKAFRILKDKPGHTASEVDPLEEAFIELNILIEDRIVGRFPELRRSSRVEQARETRRRYARGKGVAKKFLDIVILCSGFPVLGSVGAMAFSWAQDYLIDLLPRAAKQSELTDDRYALDAAVDRQFAAAELKRFLQKTGAAEQLAVSEVVETDSFAKEVMVL